MFRLKLSEYSARASHPAKNSAMKYDVRQSFGDQAIKHLTIPYNPLLPDHDEPDTLSSSDKLALFLFLRDNDPEKLMRMTALFWSYVKSAQKILKDGNCLTGQKIKTDSAYLPMDLMRVIANLEGEYDGKVIDGASAMICGSVAAHFSPPVDVLPSLQKWYAAQVLPDKIDFNEKGWVSVQLAVLMMYGMEDTTSSILLDLKTYLSTPVYVEFDYEGRHAVLLIRPWVILANHAFYKFADRYMNAKVYARGVQTTLSLQDWLLEYGITRHSRKHMEDEFRQMRTLANHSPSASLPMWA